MSSTALQAIAAAANWNLRVNENTVSMSPAGLYGINPATTTGLTLGFLGGNFNGVSVGNNTVALTASNTNYVVAHRTTGVVSAATTTTNWLDTTTYLQLYQVVAGASTITSTDDKRQAYGGATSGGSATVAVPNLIINGGFQVNQRQKSGTVTIAAGIYGHDRWKAGASGCTYTFAVTGNVTTITITAGSLQQVVEGANVRSGTHALSWTGTAQGKIGAGSYSASGITGSLTGGSNATVEFNTGTLTGVQLSLGSTAQPFLDIGYVRELFACQRYCVRFSTVSGNTTAFQSNAIWSSTTAGFVTGNFPQTMYASPTLVVEGAASNFTIFDIIAGAYSPCVTVTSNVVTNAGYYLFNFTTASGGTAARNCFFATNAQLTNSIRFEAEL
jgi:hypothetical protein